MTKLTDAFHGQRSRRVAATALCMAAAAALFMAGLQLALARQAAATSTLQQQLQSQRHLLASSLVQVPLNVHEGALQRLTSRTPSDEALIKEIQRAALSLNVSLAGVSSTATAATEQSLGRRDLTFTLNGSYTNIKAVLAELRDRHPSVVLRHLTFRRMNAPSELQAQVGVQLLSRPQVSAGDVAGTGR